MPSNMSVSASFWLPCLVLLVFWARPTAAFGAGNIGSTSVAEGKRYRHGDIEDVLLKIVISSATGKTFSKMDVKRVYFGNWLRDYSQAVDVGTVKSVSAEAIRILLWVLGFMSFGYGTNEFEVTSERLGCYRPEEHIDNPKDYADNVDARQYDRRLRGPVDEERELSINERTGLKNYIASEDIGITTSAGMVRDLLHRCIELGQRSGGQGPDFYEALRLLGTATHCMEDYSAHSNYTELALIEMGNREVFPHVGRNTQVRIEGADHPVYPIITGTFGGVDFLHSVCGEFSDKATQSELTELEGTMTNYQNEDNKSMLSGIFKTLGLGGSGEENKADELTSNAAAQAAENKANGGHITPKDPEELTEQVNLLVKQIYPAMELHDEVMKTISAKLDEIPGLPAIVESFQDQLNIFVFSVIAPFILPVLNQIKTELMTGSNEVIASSEDKQHIVFNDDNCSDPTHSMLSKDHFTNILNFPAGEIASAVVGWAVPKIVACWDGEADAEETVNCIIEGVFHHPANLNHQNPDVREGREAMFNAVERWWNSLSEERDGNEPKQDSYRQRLSREGVQQGKNHIAGPLGMDKGSGCCGKPPTGSSNYSNQPQHVQQLQQATEDLIPGMMGKFAAQSLGNFLGGAMGKEKDEEKEREKEREKEKKKKKEKYGNDDSSRYGQTQNSRHEDYSRQEQNVQGGSYGYQQNVETSGYGASGGYERREESRYDGGSQYQSEDREEKKQKHGKKYGSEDEDSGDDYEKRMRKEQKKREKEEKKHKKYGSGNEDSDDDRHKRRSGEHKRKSKSPKRRSGEYSHGQDSYNAGGGYGSQQSSGYGREEPSGYGRQETSGYGREESSGYGRQEPSGYGRQEPSGYGRQEPSGYGREEPSGYGRQEPSGYGRQEPSGYGREEPSGYGRPEPGFGRPEPGFGRPEPSGYGGGPPGGFPGSFPGGREEEPGYGRRDDDEYGQPRRHHGGGHQGGGYGDRDEGYGGRY